MEVETHYARCGEAAVAWQSVGDGPFDLVFVPGFVSHVEFIWEAPKSARFLRRLASFSRLIVFDKLGTGLSDPLDRARPLEQRMDEVQAVMDAAGSERAAIVGLSEGGQLAAVFAASYPERVRALVLMNSAARFRADEGWPGWDSEMLDELRAGADRWGQAPFRHYWAPSVADDERAVRALGRFERMSCSPGSLRSLIDVIVSSDARPALAAITAPTLVVHARGDRSVPVASGRATAALIAGARFREIESEDHLPWLTGADDMLDEVEEFLTGTRAATPPDRVLATVMFVDIVDSTGQAAALGDRRWRDLLEDFHRLSGREIERWRGRAVKSLGDGILAAFDGPGRAVSCARSLASTAAGIGLQVRSGLHTGECEVVGGDDLAGLAVHIGARVGALAAPGEVLATSTVRDLVAGSGIGWEERGARELKGVPGEWRLYAASSSSS